MTNKTLKETVSSSDEEDDGEMEVSSGNEDQEEGAEELGGEVESESDDEEESESEDVEENGATTSRVYLPNPDEDEEEELECDETAYVCYHQVQTGSSCLSFDIIPDSLGNSRADKFPLTMTIVGGTQGQKTQLNQLLVLRLSNMHRNKTKEQSAESEPESDNEDEEQKPILQCATVRHAGCVNRIKVTSLNNAPFAASWSELGKVHIWNLSRPVAAVNDKNVLASYIKNSETIKPVYTFAGHLTEGYAMDWSPSSPGVLATGDCRNNMHLWMPMEGGTWHVDQRPYTAHTGSVEDIAWSPNEENVLASCSVDRSIRIWDIRAAPGKACMLTRENAHDSDVNVISWNKTEPFILSGGDDGKLRVWDLRRFPDKEPICTFKYHTKPITSVEWHPEDSSVFAASSADDILTQWDLAIERDPDAEDPHMTPEDEKLLALPPQLLFLHQGQKEIKELHWHKQMPGVLLSTAESGFNVFRTLSI